MGTSRWLSVSNSTIRPQTLLLRSQDWQDAAQEELEVEDRFRTGTWGQTELQPLLGI